MPNTLPADHPLAPPPKDPIPEPETIIIFTGGSFGRTYRTISGLAGALRDVLTEGHRSGYYTDADHEHLRDQIDAFAESLRIIHQHRPRR